METEIKPHCWHKTQLPGTGIVKNYDGEICCNCGITWSEHDKKVPRPGHGIYDPEPVMRGKPSDGCQGLKLPHPSTPAMPPLEPGTKVFLIAGMRCKRTHIALTRTVHLIDGRWYWNDGTAVDGSAMRFEERK